MPEIDREKGRSRELNTIVLEFGRQKKDRIRDLQEGRGRLFRKIVKTISELQRAGEVGESVQPVIVIVKQKKSSSKGLWD
ncbi:hypothetical protein G7B40_013245 [Aetokthonos hydrillicola Thurmond2011]|jgi:hypothetical protein|uniref:Uncharacterized protein n=1 Tax=Aetokthonos hydrillicola Thurmond2011 TaxID=2712845 RepID=A0AAP5I857_9CYAN|nr:hypothetical protein [Aetokthonos hydrillicola]MBO3463912.1 hypothetical protein [Aetokthonos hydrillicola CCALA 1050]MBW4583781.1 hypothetical protein [Aetokthonos hydrillicola CCALA 1050]MDR9895524.1 hypothetical protein [Aetokthonos hydrillicola Thurmond2011]